jgi:hypothetical protein
VAQVVECLFCKCEALSTNPSPIKKERETFFCVLKKILSLSVDSVVFIVARLHYTSTFPSLGFLPVLEEMFACRYLEVKTFKERNGLTEWRGYKLFDTQ